MKAIKFGHVIQEHDLPRFYNTNGATSEQDHLRLIWYGPCMYWTDDWSMISSRNGIPCCPHCGAVGFQMTFAEWFDQAHRYANETDQPEYPKWLASVKERCSPDTSMWKSKENPND